MGTQTRRAMSLILATAIILLTACGGTNNGGGANTPTAKPEFVYVAEYSPLPEEMQNNWNMKYYDGTFYFTIEEYDESLNPWIDGGVVPRAPFEEPSIDDLAEPDTSDVVEESMSEVADAVDEATPEPDDTAAEPMPQTTMPPIPIDTEISEEDWMEQERIAQAYYNSRTVKLCKINVDGTGMTELSEYVEPKAEEREGFQGSAYLSNFEIDAQGGLWVHEYYSYMKLSTAPGEMYDYSYSEEYSILRKLDINGAEILSVNLNELLKTEDYSYLQTISTDADGNLYLNTGQAICVVNGDGDLSFKLESDDWFNSLVRTASGSVGTQVYDQEYMGYTFRLIDATKKGWGETINLPRNVYDLYQGGGDYEILYSDSSNLYGLNATTKESEKILNWIDCDISANLSSISMLPDGSVMGIGYDYYSDETTTEIVTISKRPASEIEEKTVLTLATVYLDDRLKSEIIRFNRGNNTCRITVEDYSQYETSDDWNAGYNKLLADLTSGKVPDLLAASNVPLQTYAGKGLFEDLYPFIDSDPELSRDSFVPGILKAMEIGGEIYQTAPSFMIQTFAAKTKYVGSVPGWTVDDMYAVLADMPEGAVPFESMTQQNLVWYSLYFGMNQYVDWSTGRCDFNNDGFINLLELAKTFPKEIDYENWEDREDPDVLFRNDRLLLYSTYLYGFDYLWARLAAGEPITYIGFPNDMGTGGALINFDTGSGVIMTTKCVDKNAAWQFLRTAFTRAYQSGDGNRYRNFGFPTNQEAMDRQVDMILYPEKYENNVGMGGLMMVRSSASRSFTTIIGGEEVEVGPPTREDIDAILALVEVATGIYGIDEKITEIINEEVGPFFAGQKPARDVANIIQNRVQTYVNEQR